MADIFLSYERSDYARAQKIAGALEKYGWSVWWDRKLMGGVHFDQAIEQALGAAKCVIALWSKASVSSDWVKDEAREGAKRGILVPVLIDDVQIPIGFRQIQAVRLANWNAYSLAPDFRDLLDSVSHLIGRPRNVGTPPPRSSPPKSSPELINLKTWLWWSIGATFFFFPTGCVALYSWIKANSAFGQGDLKTARMYVTRARKWIIATAVIVVFFIILRIVNPAAFETVTH